MFKFESCRPLLLPHKTITAAIKHSSSKLQFTHSRFVCNEMKESSDELEELREALESARDQKEAFGVNLTRLAVLPAEALRTHADVRRDTGAAV